MNQESLVSISEASHVLGVSEAALRQWTDSGKIKAFITPGGHRRYSMEDLKKFITSHQKMLGIKDLVVELEDTAQLHREIGRKHLNSTSWYHQLGQETQEHLGGLGRRLLDLIIRYITERSKREEIAEQARNIGREHGEMLVKLGLPLTDSVEAFILHRDPIMNAATHLMKKRGVLNARVVEALPLVHRIMDEALVSLVAAHQHYKDAITNQREGDAAQ